MSTTFTPGEPVLRLRAPADVLAAVPYVLGFHPADSLVGLAIGGPAGRLRVAGRVDLPGGGGDAREAVAADLANLLTRGGRTDAAVLVGYGPAARVTPAIDALRAALRDRGVAVREALRADNGRYWSYECHDPSCCPPEGAPYDVASSVVAARATAAGRVALPDREAVERSVAPAAGLVGAAMRQATARAEARLRERLDARRDGRAPRRALVEEGTATVRGAVVRYRDGGRLDDDETAWLGALLKTPRVRDEAWVSIDDQHRSAHRALWTDVVRRVEHAYVPAPACLLAVAAWQDGDGVLAGIAVDRALRADDGYPMAGLLDRALGAGLPPSAAYPPMTPEQLAAAYDEEET